MAGIDLRDILNSDGDCLPALCLPRPLSKDDAGLPAEAGAEEADWQNDPVPIKIDKIRAAVMNAKSAWEVETEAKRLPVGDWLELVSKLMPKNVQIQASFSFQHLVEESGPINNDAYKPKTIEAELG